MSEHRRKPPQPQSGGRAAARRAAQQSSGRRAAQPRSATGSESAPHGEESPYGGRAEARRAAQRGTSRRRGADPDAGGAGHGGGRRAAGGGRGGRGRGDGDGRPVKKRFIDYPRAGKDGFRRWVPSWKLVTGTFLFFFAMLVGAVGIGLWLVEVPTAQAASKVEKNVYYWADGKQMVVSGGSGDLNRQIVPLSEIPESMQNAVISAENASFYDDAGVDPMGIARAVVNMAKGGATQSGSTITQQYVKNTYLDQSQTLTRKAKELFISIKVGATMDKDDILAGYLNTAYYGRGAYGCQAAARAYYDKDCAKLSASESAFLAATLNGPNLYDPAGGYGANASKEANTKRAKTRWEWILNREVEVGKMDKAERQALAKFPMPREPKIATNKEGQIGYLTSLADKYITSHTKIDQKMLDKGGYEIHTTFDRKKMNQLETAVKKVTKENINPKLRPKYDKYVQFGGASVEPKTGKIVAIYGGKDALEHYTNNADYTGVQVGSTFKPFVLAAAMKDGVRDKDGDREQPDSMRTLVSPSSVYDGDNKLTLRDYNGTVWHDKDGKEWHQRNDGDEDRGKITLRTAMQYSVNTPYIQLGMDVGTDKVRDAAIAAGLNQDQMASITPTFSLGTSAPSAIRLAGAYATFAASGKQADPYSVERVERKGEEPYNHKEEAELRTAFDASVADNVTDVLQNVVEHGTGTSAQIGRPAAGKTGTTDENKSAWFSGYTPQLSTAIGMWRVDDKAKKQEFLSMRGVGTGRPNESIHGASYPAEIWADYMREAMKGKKVVEFPDPEPIGKKIFGDGASPTPPPSKTPSRPPSQTPSETPSTTPSSQTPSSSPSPTDTCDPLDFECNNNGGANGNGGNGNGGNGNGGNGSGGDAGGGTSTPTTEPPGSDNGGWFGGGG
ncbi:transglycosylase domain-containing protein [Streptomyces sp. LZ34]